jgi:alkaline phosphatase D
MESKEPRSLKKRTNKNRNSDPSLYWVSVLFLIFLLFPGHISAGDTRVAETRILFGSCLDAEKPHPILNRIIDMNPDLFIFLGDNIYADTVQPEKMEKKYRALASSLLFQRLRATCPVLAVWDDHDYGANDAGKEYPMKRASRRIFLDFWEIPPDASRRKNPGIYDTVLVGSFERSVQIILLDTRYFRTSLRRGRAPTPIWGPYLPDNRADATLLGDEQWDWLEQQLELPARIRVIVSSVQVLAEHHGWESWANFPEEQKRLFRLIKKTGAEGVLFISGDRHFSELSVRFMENLYPLFDLTSSGLNRIFPAKAPNENRYRNGKYYLKENFGMISIDWSRPDPLILLRIYDEAGNIKLEKSLSLSSFSFK